MSTQITSSIAPALTTQASTRVVASRVVTGRIPELSDERASDTLDTRLDSVVAQILDDVCVLYNVATAQLVACETTPLGNVWADERQQQYARVLVVLSVDLA